ncbi:MAG: hypothetical protein Q9P01_03190 [Anaerolineae bacterium]|nr:hypothetical protein [Anaerolineae bacterium]
MLSRNFIENWAIFFRQPDKQPITDSSAESWVMDSLEKAQAEVTDATLKIARLQHQLDYMKNEERSYKRRLNGFLLLLRRLYKKTQLIPILRERLADTQNDAYLAKWRFDRATKDKKRLQETVETSEETISELEETLQAWQQRVQLLQKQLQAKDYALALLHKRLEDTAE